MQKFASWIHHFFVPRERNNFRARALHLHSLATYLLFFLSLSFIATFSDNYSNVLGYATDVTVEKLYQLTNEEREKNGLEPLTYNPQLAAAAEQKANDMFARNYWSHYGPDGTTPWSFILSTGYKYEYAGENLAKNFLFSDGVVRAWMESPTHRENILRNEYSEIGFAVVNGVLNGEETTLVVQMFGTPFGGPAPVQAADINPGTEVAQVPQQVPAQNAQDVLVQQPEVQTANMPAVAQAETGFAWSKLLYNTKLVFLFFLMATFILDFYIAIKLNVIQVHVRGKHLAHIFFLFFIISGLVIIVQGKIL